MNEASISKLKSYSGLVLINALNAIALLLSSINLEQGLYELGLDGSIGVALRSITRASVYGLLLGQLACLGLWLSLSNRSMRDKLRIYFWFASVLVGAMTIFGWDEAPWSTFHYLGVAIVMPCLIAAGLRWSSSPIRLVELEYRSVTRNRVGVTLVQTICAAAAIAFCLVTYAASTRILETYATFMCFVVFWSASCSVLAVAGLMMMVQFKHQGIPVGLGLATMLFATIVAFYEADNGIDELTLWDCCICFAWLATLPMIFVWLAPRFGFIVEADSSSPASTENQSPPSDNDPFAEDETGEPST